MSPINAADTQHGPSCEPDPVLRARWVLTSPSLMTVLGRRYYYCFCSAWRKLHTGAAKQLPRGSQLVNACVRGGGCVPTHVLGLSRTRTRALQYTSCLFCSPECAVETVAACCDCFKTRSSFQLRPFRSEKRSTVDNCSSSSGGIFNALTFFN